MTVSSYLIVIDPFASYNACNFISFRFYRCGNYETP